MRVHFEKNFKGEVNARTNEKYMNTHTAPKGKGKPAPDCCFFSCVIDLQMMYLTSCSKKNRRTIFPPNPVSRRAMIAPLGVMANMPAEGLHRPQARAPGGGT